MRTKKSIFTALLIMLILPSAVSGQIVYNQPKSSSLIVHYNSWSLENTRRAATDPLGREDDLYQRTFLLSGFLPLRDNCEARYNLISASNRLDYDNSASELSGFSDLRLQVAHSFKKDRLLLSAGLNLPTGKQKLDSTEEARVIEFLSRDYLSLPLRRYGEGFGFNLQGGGAAKISRFTCGMSALYYYSGTYEPYSGGGDYNPGNTFSLNATANTVAGKMSYAADLVYTLTGVDKYEDTKIYKQAQQFGTRLTASYLREPYRATLGVRMLLRGRNKRYSLSTGAVDSQLKKYGDEFDVYLRMAYTPAVDWHIAAHLATRQISSGEENLDASSLYNFGLIVSKELASRLSLEVGGVYHTGSTNDDTLKIDGYQISAGVAVTY